MSNGYEAMEKTIEGLTLTALDLIQDTELLAKVKKEFSEQMA